MSKPFFDSFPRFYQSGNTTAGPRLNARYDCLIEKHGEFILGKRVLDIGSHDGRWSFAALQAGASHVTGVEPRADLVAHARANVAAYGVGEDRYSFVAADALEWLSARKPKFDTIFLFGVFYHMHYHVALLKALHATGATAMIIDTHVAPDVKAGRYANAVFFISEKVDNISNSAHELFPGSGQTVVGHPSRNFVRFLWKSFGFQVQERDWSPLVGTWGTKGLQDYAEGRRTTFLARAGA